MPNEDHYYLGFDADCSYCSRLASRVQETVGPSVSVLPLGNENMRIWRQAEFGADAPWAPTLVRVRDGQSKAWIGWKIGPTLTSQLGAKPTSSMHATHTARA